MSTTRAPFVVNNGKTRFFKENIKPVTFPKAPATKRMIEKYLSAASKLRHFS